MREGGSIAAVGRLGIKMSEIRFWKTSNYKLYRDRIRRRRVWRSGSGIGGAAGFSRRRRGSQISLCR
ncbi:protein of unknown function [Burkholderia multivorans]